MHRFYRNTVEHVFFGSGQFSELANLVFETVEISEFAHVEFLPMPIKVNSAERLTHRFSVLAPNFRSCWVYRKYLLYQKEGKGVVMTKYIGILFQRIRLDPRHDVNGFVHVMHYVNSIFHVYRNKLHPWGTQLRTYWYHCCVFFLQV